MLLQPSGFLLWMQSIWMEIEPCDFGKATFEKTGKQIDLVKANK